MKPKKKKKKKKTKKKKKKKLNKGPKLRLMSKLMNLS